MSRDSFFDTNVIFNYSNYIGGVSGKLIEKCYFYIENKKGKFILCGAVLRELSEITKKRGQIHKSVIDKICKPNSSFEDNPLIHQKDIPFAKKLYEKYKNYNKEKISKELARERDLSEIKIERFLKMKVDEKVIPLEQINEEIVNKIHEIISNHSDCRILASALQLQETKETIFLFVTADNKDFDPNSYEYLKKQFELDGVKMKFPELHNLIFTNGIT